jgi:hypothetical protein
LQLLRVSVALFSSQQRQLVPPRIALQGAMAHIVEPNVLQPIAPNTASAPFVRIHVPARTAANNVMEQIVRQAATEQIVRMVA